MLDLNLSYHNVVYAIKFLFVTKKYYILQCENRLMANAAGKQLEWRTKDIAPPTSSRKLA